MLQITKSKEALIICKQVNSLDNIRKFSHKNRRQLAVQKMMSLMIRKKIYNLI